MKKLLIITGDLATGKSTFAGLLTHRYGTSVFCKDKIKEILGDTIGFANREENLRLSRATMEIMTHIFSQIAPLGKDLILEANFRSGELKRLHKIAAENGYEVLTLVLRGHVDILYLRFMNRINNENRHSVHISGFDGFTSFNDYIEKSRCEETFGEILKISADDFSYQNDAEILAKIDGFMIESK